MLYKTQGIVLNYIKYGETSIIVKIFTEDFGLNSYIVNSVRSAKGKTKIAFFQPLTHLDLVVYENKKGTLKRISEMKCPQPLISIPTDIRKTSIGIFMTEILVKCLHDHEENKALFSFLQQAILMLEHLEKKYGNFHLQFLLKFARFLGFEPSSSQEIIDELKEGGFKIKHWPESIDAMNDLIGSPFENQIHITNHQRGDILQDLLSFYQLHVAGLGKIKSVEVLSEVLN